MERAEDGLTVIDGKPWRRLPFAAEDDAARRIAIGALVLASDIATEDELRAFLPAAGASVYASRIPRDRASTLTNLRQMEPRIADAAARLVPDDDLHVIAFACTSGAAAIGAERVADIVRGVRPGVPVTDPLSAGARALRAFGMKRIALMTPYRAEVNGMIAAQIEKMGFEIVASASFFCEDGYQMSRISARSIAEGALAVASGAEVEALFISCTALRLSADLAKVEARLAKPVVFSTQAMAWDAMRLTGTRTVASGRGRLFDL